MWYLWERSARKPLKPGGGSFSSFFPPFSPFPTPTIFLNSLFKLMLHYPHLLLIGGFYCCVGLSEGRKHRSIISRGKKIVSVLNVLLRSVIAPLLRTWDADDNYSPAVAIDDQTRYTRGRNGIGLVLPLIFSQPVSLCLRFRFIGFQGCEMWNPRGEILGEVVHNRDNSWGIHGDTDFWLIKD